MKTMLIISGVVVALIVGLVIIANAVIGDEDESTVRPFATSAATSVVTTRAAVAATPKVTPRPVVSTPRATVRSTSAVVDCSTGDERIYLDALGYRLEPIADAFGEMSTLSSMIGIDPS